jgi:uncharacterized protein DUF6093
MSRASVLAAGRKAAELGMIDACTIDRITGTETDPTTGARTETAATVYSGPCRLQEIFGFSRDTQPSPDQSQLARYRVLQLPVTTSEDVRVGDRVTVTGCVHDPDMVGARFIVRDQSGKTEATSRRVGVEEITG